jgi:hypothetical protein
MGEMVAGVSFGGTLYIRLYIMDTSITYQHRQYPLPLLTSLMSFSPLTRLPKFTSNTLNARSI